MKLLHLFFCGTFSCLWAACSLYGAPTVLERGQNYRLLQTQQTYINEYGQEVVTPGRFTELKAGMHYQENGRWVESEEIIEPHPQGAVARRGAYQVIFNQNLNTAGAIDILLPDQQRLRGHVLGLALTDAATGESVLIGEVQDSQGEIVPPNRILFPNAFKGIAADMQYTYSMGQFEADVILHERPVLPARFNPKTTRLEVLTEFVEAPAARTTKMNLKKASEDTAQDPKLLLPFQDEAIDFGAMLMGPGRAFKRVEGEAQGEDSGSASALPVAKDWRQVEGRHILIEAVEYEAFSAYLAGLPQSAGLSHSLRSRFQREWPLIGQAAGLAQPMKVASVTPASPGAVIDYVLVVSQASWTFNSGTTYYVNGWVWIKGAMTINGGAIIKYAPNASLWVSGTLTCNASSANRAVLTAVDDNSVGESIGSGAPSGYYANDALNLYNVQTYSVLQGLHFRYAQDAIFNYSPYGPHYVNNCEFLACQRGVVGYYTTIYLNNDLMCDVDYATYNYGNAYFYTSGLSQISGTVDNDGDLLANKPEMLRLSNPLVANSQSGLINDGVYFLLAQQNGPTKAKITELVFLPDGRIRLKLEFAETGVPYDIFMTPDLNQYWRLHYAGSADGGATGPTRYYTVANPGTPMAFFTFGDGRDSDSDGLKDGYEILVTHTIVGKSDSNNNGILDGAENPDGDWFTNSQEYTAKLNPNSAEVITAQTTNIKFNHNTGSSANDAINIRPNGDPNAAGYDISNGEWVKDGQNLPVCYTANRSVTIQARITMSPTNITSAAISAISTDADGSLGNVYTTPVTFVNGVSSPEYITFTLAPNTPNCVKKTTSDVWQWKVSNINGCGSSANNMNSSGSHTVYTVLSDPVAPWDNTAGSQSNAWTSALDFVIASASCNGMATSSEILTRISQYLHGSSGKTYDTQRGDSHYGMIGPSGDFNFTSYMSYGGTVNCYDQAAGVTTCSRLMGIGSLYLFMQPFGYIRATYLVGIIGPCNNPFYPNLSPPYNVPLLGPGGITDLTVPYRTAFANHAFVYSNGNIWDATGGPHIGTETLQAFATSSIDISSLGERSLSPDANWDGAFSDTEAGNVTWIGNVSQIH